MTDADNLVTLYRGYVFNTHTGYLQAVMNPDGGQVWTGTELLTEAARGIIEGLLKPGNSFPTDYEILIEEVPCRAVERLAPASY